jgi:hypothetical protein
VLAILADHAIAHPQDGKLYVTGGGIRRLRFGSFPATQPHLALALGIDVDSSEIEVEHELEIARSPAEAEWDLKPVRVKFRVAATRHHAEYVHFVSNIDNVQFPEPGTYSFAIAIDGVEIGRVDVIAELAPKTEATETVSDESEELMHQGYAAFGEGNMEGAEQAFRAVTDRFPSLPGGHNNLAYILLSKADTKGALAELARARDLGYPQPEILNANVAAATYLDGDFTSARDQYIECFRSQIFRIPALLFGISESGLFSTYVQSAAEYAALMALNVAWSSHAAGDRVLAERYLVAAETLASARASVAEPVVASLDALRADYAEAEEAAP